jgi:hypothetical protein
MYTREVLPPRSSPDVPGGLGFSLRQGYQREVFYKVELGWIIQDVGGMVDLVFTLGEQIRNSMNFLLAHFEHNSPLGHYNGILMDTKGERMLIRGLWGVGEKLYLRV